MGIKILLVKLLTFMVLKIKFKEFVLVFKRGKAKT